MLTATIGSIHKDKDQAWIYIYYYEGAEVSFNEKLYLSPKTTLDDVKKHASEKIQFINDLSKNVDTFVVGQSLDAVVSVPSQNDIDRQEFNDKYQKLRNLVKAAEDGVIPKDSTLIIDLQDELKTKFDPSWLSLTI